MSMSLVLSSDEWEWYRSFRNILSHRGSQDALSQSGEDGPGVEAREFPVESNLVAIRSSLTLRMRSLTDLFADLHRVRVPREKSEEEMDGKAPPAVLTIAGSDSSGGAGIQVSVQNIYKPSQRLNEGRQHRRT